MDGEGTVPIRSDLVAVVAESATALRSSGTHVERGLPPGLSDALGIYKELRAADGMADIAALTHGREDLLTHNSRVWLSARCATTVEDFQIIASRRDALRAQLLRFMSKWPIWLMPVASIPAFCPNDSETNPVPEAFDVEGISIPRYGILACCWATSLLGVPVAVVPCGTSSEGLPVGIQIVGRPFAEHEVLAVATVLEDYFGPWRPPRDQPGKASFDYPPTEQ
jgi:amidase